MDVYNDALIKNMNKTLKMQKTFYTLPAKVKISRWVLIDRPANVPWGWLIDCWVIEHDKDIYDVTISE